MQQMRKHRRHKLPLRVEICHKSIGTLQVEANDMSEGGVFLLMDECFQLEIGEIVKVRSVGLGVSGNETGPELDMRVVRRSDIGMGLAILEQPEPASGDARAASPATPEQTSSQRTSSSAILQRFLLIDDLERVLLQRQGDHWHLPARELADGERWSEGLQNGLDEIRTAGVISAPQTIAATNQCAANKESVAGCAEFLIPCRVFNGAAEELANQSSYRWAQLDELNQQHLCIDRRSVDILLSRV